MSRFGGRVACVMGAVAAAALMAPAPADAQKVLKVVPQAGSPSGPSGNPRASISRR